MSLSADQLTFVRGNLADPGTNAAQAILIQNAASGTFTVTFNGQTTSALAYNAGSNDLQNALAALSNVGLGNVQVNNVFPYAIYFIGALGNVAQPMITVNSSLLGPQVSVTVSQTQAGGVQAFSDSDLNLLYTQADLNLYLAVAYGYRWLMAGGSKLNDYVAGQTQEKKSQIFAHLQEMEALFTNWSRAGEQVQLTRLQGAPPRVRAYPVVVGVPAAALSIAPPYPWGPWATKRNWGGW